MYWTDVAGKVIRRAFVNGSHEEDVIHLSQSIWSFMSSSIKESEKCGENSVMAKVGPSFNLSFQMPFRMA